MVFNAFSVLGAQNTRDLGTGVPKTRGYPNLCGVEGRILLPTSRHFENRRGEGPGEEVGFLSLLYFHGQREMQKVEKITLPQLFKILGTTCRNFEFYVETYSNDSLNSQCVH